MDATTTVLWFVSTQIYVYQNLLNAFRSQTKVVWNKWIEGENLGIKPHVGLMKVISHFGGVHFDDTFITFGVASCIMVPDPILRMALFCDISCWNHISDYHTVLIRYNLTWWQLTPLHYKGVLSWMAIFHIVFNEMIFRYHSNSTHNWNFMILVKILWVFN